MRLFVSIFLMFLLFLLMFIQPVEASEYPKYANTEEVCTVAAQQFEEKYQVKKHLLTTITNLESGRWNPKVQRNTAWPWTINAQGKGQYFATKQQAIAAVKRLQAKGVKSIDVGCMQINLAYHPDAFENLEEAFNPYKNVEYGAKFLKKLYKQKGNNWNRAATAYHSNLPQKAKKYAIKLSKVYKDIVQAGIEAKPAKKSVVQATLNPKPVDKQVAKIKKLEKESVLAKNKMKIDAKVARAANEWREAKLAEYRLKKARQL
ncbi:MAG: lytic transglycosylase domain-containing protein [Alphaproteobacteria bacterium]|nr:lytic transglycosylase domain-containing protein [Alphaproteobacteria bacterium]